MYLYLQKRHRSARSETHEGNFRASITEELHANKYHHKFLRRLTAQIALPAKCSRMRQCHAARSPHQQPTSSTPVPSTPVDSLGADSSLAVVFQYHASPSLLKTSLFFFYSSSCCVCDTKINWEKRPSRKCWCAQESDHVPPSECNSTC